MAAIRMSVNGTRRTDHRSRRATAYFEGAEVTTGARGGGTVGGTRSPSETRCAGDGGGLVLGGVGDGGGVNINVESGYKLQTSVLFRNERRGASSPRDVDIFFVQKAG